MRTHTGDRPDHDGRPTRQALFRVKVDADGATIGSLWAARAESAGLPSREQTRLLALAADQLGLALRHAALSAAATAAEVVRESDAQKSALLTSVSHDLRTPLASIRAAAGSLLDPAVTWSDEERRSVAASIDAEAERLNRLVRNLLDLSRIEGGGLRPDLDAFDLEDLLSPVVDRLRSQSGRRIEVAVADDLPPVLVDPVFLDESVANLLENAVTHAGSAARIRLVGRVADDAHVRLTVEDSGAGVPEAALGGLFDRFRRVRRPGDGQRRGLGLGLSVVRGFVEAMSGSVSARHSELGGLAVDVLLPVAPDGERPGG
jgi:two-component system sensor histidine kinase KdpD